MIKRIFTVLLGVLLLLAGFRGLIITVAGETTTGVVTGHKQVIGKNSKKIDHNYNVNYSFVDDAGTERNGSYLQMRVYDTSRLPSSGTPIEIRYFKPYSGLSVPASKFLPSLYDLLIAGAGVLMMLGVGGSAVHKRRQAAETASRAATDHPHSPPQAHYPQQPGYPPQAQYPQQPGYPPQAQYPQQPGYPQSQNPHNPNNPPPVS